MASKEDSTRFICFLSSHGDNTSLVCPRNAYGEENVKIRDVLKCANTPQLKDCPKIFFIDACRKYYQYIYFFYVELHEGYFNHCYTEIY